MNVLITLHLAGIIECPPSADGKPSAIDIPISFPLLVKACNLEKQRATEIIIQKPMVVARGR